MRRIIALLSVAVVGFALLPAVARAQVVYVQPAQSYYVAPVTYSYYPPTTTYSYYPSTTTYYYSAPATTYSYYAPPTTYYSYSAPAPTYYSYSAPAAVVAPGGVVTTRSYYGYGIFRPRGLNVETYYTPLR